MHQNPLYKIASFLSLGEAQGVVASSYLPCWTTQKDVSSVIGRMRSFYTGSRPIKDEAIENFIKTININNFHNDVSIDKKLNNIIYDWLLDSKSFDFKGIKNFKHLDTTFGVTQSIDNFFLRFQNKQIGITQNEYWYVNEVAKNNRIYSAQTDNIRPNSVVLCSSPHSFLGDDMNEFIIKAKSQNCYVAVDLTYATLCNNTVKLNLDCVDECWISLNKTWPVATFRTGFRFSKNKIDDSISWISSMPLSNRIGGGLIFKLMQNYSVNYIVEKYKDVVKKICKSCDLEQTNILTIAKSHDYKNYFPWTASKYNQNLGERINLSSIIENYKLLQDKNII